MERYGDGFEQIRNLLGVCRLEEDETLEFPQSARHRDKEHPERWMFSSTVTGAQFGTGRVPARMGDPRRSCISVRPNILARTLADLSVRLMLCVTSLWETAQTELHCLSVHHHLPLRPVTPDPDKGHCTSYLVLNAACLRNASFPRPVHESV